MRTVMVFIGHGSRYAAADQAFEALVAAYAGQYPGSSLSHGYIECAEPHIDRALEQAALQAAKVILVPILLFRGGHAKKDLPLALAKASAAHPDVEFCSTDVLGVHPKLARLAYKRSCQTALLPTQHPEKTAVIYIGRGSRDPKAIEDFYEQARIFAGGKGFGWFWPCFAGLQKPSLKETLASTARARPQQLLIVPHLLFMGLLLENIQRQLAEFCKEHSWLSRAEVAPPLGIDRLLLEVIHERVSTVRPAYCQA